MTENQDVIVFYDDSDVAFDFTSGTSDWVVESDSKWAGGTRTVHASDTRTGEFSVTFQGTVAILTGSVPEGTSNYMVQIDNDAPSTVSVNAFISPHRAWYQSPILSDGEHTIRFMQLLSGFAVDYATITPGPEDTIRPRSVLVDNLSPEIVYTGPWAVPKIKPSVNSRQVPVPYEDSVHVGSTRGNKIAISFAGSSIELFGQLQLGRPMSVNFTLDNGVPETIIFPTISAANGSDETMPNFPLYSRRDLPGVAVHNLEVVLLEDGQDFALDYCMYEPNFANAKYKPNLLPPNPLSVKLQAVVGAVVASLFLLLVCFVFFFKRWRRNRRIRKPRSTDVSMSVELGSFAQLPMPRRAPPNAFASAPISRSTRPNLTPTPFEIPDSEWLEPTTPRASPEKPAPLLPLEGFQHPSERHRPMHTTHQIDELYRVVTMLSEETQRLKGQLGERRDSAVLPPSYEESVPSDDPNSPQNPYPPSPSGKLPYRPPTVPPSAITNFSRPLKHSTFISSSS
ncbi:hypothetical protein FA15DRAFT_711251 [Coprinopsis marcescibilis]|uniref:Uncharacterized protein n=1 Tax=Coprinopsis marcescibilis TaxID=230819 RepID=A0A5C3KAF1_COPMA|nr:hypothetical protein FA15DRAFT_711251 [Coprinopsis marcescibilis]